MKLSARNMLQGKVVDVRKDDVAAQIEPLDPRAADGAAPLGQDVVRGLHAGLLSSGRPEWCRIRGAVVQRHAPSSAGRLPPCTSTPAKI